MDVVAALREIVGDAGVLGAANVATRSAGVWRPDNLQARALVRPRTTAEVAAVLRWCHANDASVVAQGGLTGLVHGADAGPGDIILSLERMRTIERIDPRQRVAVVEAGVTLQALQEAADRHDLAFPLDLGARGIATLGGNAATNAGGNRVIRYGMMRDMVLGVEAVLADGTIVSSLNELLKNNTGYDLKQLFIGSEGTLGVITRLVLRLREKPLSTSMAFVACPDFDAVAALLKHMDRSLGGTLSAFEVMWQPFYRLVTTPPAQGRPPVAQDHPLYVLIEAQGADPARDTESFAAALDAALGQGLILDAAIARSGADCQAFWGLRDDVAQVLRGGVAMIFDVSLPIGEMARYTADLQANLPPQVPPDKLWIFGHLGDGNLHIIVQVAPADYAAARPLVEALVYGLLAPFHGAVSAEHGIGLEKKPWLGVSRNEAELALMRMLKAALDPKGILNPGKIF